MSNETEKEELIKQVEWLHKQFKDAAKPFTDRLAKLVALEPSPPLTVDFLNSIPEGVKNAFADAVATGTGIYNAADPARVIPAESIRTPSAASGQQEMPPKPPFDMSTRYGTLCYSETTLLKYGAACAAAAHPAPAQQESATAPAALTDEQVIEIVRTAVKNGSLNWIGFEPDSEGKFTIPFVSQGTLKLARAILATASAAPAERARDAERLDFLISECAIVEEIGGNRYRLHWPDSQEWQQEMHGSAREAIDAAIASQQKGGA